MGGVIFRLGCGEGTLRGNGRECIRIGVCILTGNLIFILSFPNGRPECIQTGV